MSLVGAYSRGLLRGDQLRSPLRERTSLRVVGAALVCSVALPAWAGAGDHVRVGDATITPSVAVNLEQTNNAYHSDTTPASGTRLRIAPGVLVASEGSRVDLSIAGTYDARKYLQSALANLNRFNDFNLGGTVRALKTGVIGLSFEENMGLRNQITDAEFSARPFQTQYTNQMGATVAIRPGSALEVGVGGFWNYQDVNVAAGAQASGVRDFNTANVFGPKAAVEWRFFPRTSMLVNASYESYRWGDNVIASTDPTIEDVVKPDSDHLKVTGGIRGRVTEKVTVVLAGGYGSATYDDATVGGAADAAAVDSGAGADIVGANRFIVDAQFRYEPSNDDKLVLGFERNFRDVFFSNFVSFNQVYVRGSTRFGPRVGVSGDVGLRVEGFRGQMERNDVFVQGSGDLSYYLKDWSALTAGASWMQRISDNPLVDYGELSFRVGSQFVY